MTEYAWYDVGPGRQVYRRVPDEPAARSHLPCPTVRSDRMEPAEHPLTGQMIDSKSRFESITKAHGYVTMGDDPARLRRGQKQTPDRKQIRASLEKAKARLGA